MRVNFRCKMMIWWPKNYGLLETMCYKGYGLREVVLYLYYCTFQETGDWACQTC